MTDKEGSSLKWSGNEMSMFLGVYRKYEELWNTNNEKYLKKNARQNGMKKLHLELTNLGFKIQCEEQLRRKIKNIRDVYRNELNKVKKSLKSGAGVKDVYKPKLIWFEEADSFLNNVMSGRQSSSNLDDTLTTTRMTDGGGNDDDYHNVDDPDESSQPQPVTVPHENYEPQETPQSRRAPSSSLIINKQAMESLQPPRKKIKGKSGPLTSLSQSVDKLHEITVMPSQDAADDEYDHFAKHIASQLRKLPTRSFILLQEKIQGLVTGERLKNLVCPSRSVSTTPTPSSYSLLSTSSYCEYVSPSSVPEAYPSAHCVVDEENRNSIPHLDEQLSEPTPLDSIQKAILNILH